MTESPRLFPFFINLQFTNSNWFKFLIYVRSQISCNPQSLICYYAKKLMKTKSSKKIWYQGHSSKLPYLTNLESFLREQTQSAHSWCLFYYFIHSNKFIVYTCAYVINLLYPQPGHLFVFVKKKLSFRTHRKYPFSLELFCFLPDLISQWCCSGE